MAELYIVVNSIAPPIMNSLFQFRHNTNNIRNFQEIYTENRKTGKSDLSSAVSLGESTR